MFKILEIRVNLRVISYMSDKYRRYCDFQKYSYECSKLNIYFDEEDGSLSDVFFHNKQW